MNRIIHPIAGQHRSGSAHFFNAAAVGLPSQESLDACRDSSLGWDESLAAVRSGFGSLLGQPDEHVTVFHNTTAGLQRVFLRLGRLLEPAEALLLTTDLEYPGTLAMLDECWEGPIVIAQVAEALWEGRAADVNDVLRRTFLLTRPAVVYVSHVARATGYPIDTEFLRFVKEVNPATVIVIDGAQAVANVAVEPELLRHVDFYVTSGHKWLGGRQTLGVVCAHPRWHVADPAQAYSRLVGSGGTGDLETLRSTSVALHDFFDAQGYASARVAAIAVHNAALAARFMDGLAAARIPLWPICRLAGNLGHWDESGMVSVTGDLASMARVVANTADLRQLAPLGEDGRFMASLLTAEPWVSLAGASSPGPRLLASALEDSIALCRVDLREDAVRAPMPAGGLLRFCFHFFHGSDDVDRLLAALLACHVDGAIPAHPSMNPHHESNAAMRRAATRPSFTTGTFQGNP